jgi:hypothetical protein
MHVTGYNVVTLDNVSFVVIKTVYWNTYIDTQPTLESTQVYKRTHTKTVVTFPFPGFYVKYIRMNLLIFCLLNHKFSIS